MHAVGVLQKLLQDSIPSLHLNRLRALISTVRSAMTTRRLTLSGLARGLPTGQAIRHRIKRVDRLLGNRHLHNERPLFYQLLCRQFMAQDKRPVILVDWSDLKADRSWLVLRAALWIRGAAVPIYESVHPLRDQNSPSVERSFLTQLKSLLPQGLRPIVVTDAGFRGPWFTYLNQLGWYWVGRIRGRTFLRSGDDPWRRCTADYARANARPSEFGRTRNDPFLSRANSTGVVSKATAAASSTDSVQATQAQQPQRGLRQAGERTVVAVRLAVAGRGERA